MGRDHPNKNLVTGLLPLQCSTVLPTVRVVRDSGLVGGLCSTSAARVTIAYFHGLHTDARHCVD